MKIKREAIEWILIVTVFGTLYITGWHTEVIGQLQRVIVATGLMQPKLISENKQADADYGFLLIDQNGNKKDFREFEGKTVFLNFWATWCPPCIAEMPDIHSLYQGTKDSDVEFVLISLDEDFEKAKAFVERKGYGFPIYSLTTRRPDVFQSQSIPSTFIISKEGKIVAKRAGMAKYDTDEIRELLGAE